MPGKRESKRKKLLVVYSLAVLLMIIRVDIWWWGEEMPMVFLGWINLPMLYQFAIWLAGYLLVIYVATRIWVEDE